MSDERDTAEQQARGILVRMGFEYAYEMSAGEVVEIANLIADRNALRALVTRLADALEECASDLDTELRIRYGDQHGGPCIHPAVRPKYDRDIEPVIVARALVSEARRMTNKEET